MKKNIQDIIKKQAGSNVDTIKVRVNLKDKKIPNKKKKLNYRFHNPNTEEEITKFMIDLLLDVHKPMIDEKVKRNLDEKE